MYKKILIYNSGGGIGDSIQLFSLILSIKNHFKKCELYYLTSHDNHFEGKLNEYGIKLKPLKLKIKYFGFRWWHIFFTKRSFLKCNINKFDLIIDTQSKLRNTLILKKIPHTNFYSSTYNFRYCTFKNYYIKKKNIVDMILANLNIFFGIEIKKINYDLINIPKKILDEAKKLLPNNSYVGFSITQGNSYRKKKWPIEKIIQLANKIKLRNKVPVFFVEKENYSLVDEIKNAVPNAIFPEHNSKISCPALVTALTTRLDKAISIDNGIMHMMGLTNIPLVVLFGPTNYKKFSPRNKNVLILDSNIIYKSNDISKIGVEEVLRNI